MASILLIDDDHAVLASVERMLADDGHQVLAISSSVAAVERFRAERPELVITDILMPQQEGIETIRALRAIDPAIPIIAISGGMPIRAGIDFLKFARDLGATASLAKPFRAAQLCQLVRQVLAPRPR